MSQEHSEEYLDVSRLSKYHIHDAFQITKDKLKHSFGHTKLKALQARKAILVQIQEYKDDIQQNQILITSIRENADDIRTQIKADEAFLKKMKKDLGNNHTTQQEIGRVTKELKRKIKRYQHRKDKYLQKINKKFAKISPTSVSRIYENLFSKYDPVEVSVVKTLIGLLKNTLEPKEDDVELHLRTYEGLEFKMTHLIPEEISSKVLRKIKKQNDANISKLLVPAASATGLAISSKYVIHYDFAKWISKAVDFIEFVHSSQDDNKKCQEAEDQMEKLKVEERFIKSEIKETHKKLEALNSELLSLNQHITSLLETEKEKKKQLEQRKKMIAKFSENYFDNLKSEIKTYKSQINTQCNKQ